MPYDAGRRINDIEIYICAPCQSGDRSPLANDLTCIPYILKITMETNDKNEQQNPNLPPTEKSAEDVLNEIEKESAENVTSEESISINEPAHEEHSEGLLGKIGLGKKDKHHKKELQELKEKVADLNDKNLRLLAEFDNFRKRNAKERLELLKSAGQDVLQTILPTFDDFERALQLMEKATDVVAVRDGVSLIYNKLKSTLESRGLKQFDSVGEIFDAEKHEAITEVPAASEDMKGKVVAEIEKGYMLNDKIIRYAKVVVGK